MRDLSLHLMDLAQNSIAAGATLLQIGFAYAQDRRELVLTLEDDGCGMDAAMAQKAQSPFTTTRTTRKVGMGIPLFKENAERTGGSFSLTSAAGKGTKVTAVFRCDSIDMKPLGDLGGTLAALIVANPVCPDFVFSAATPKGETVFDTRAVKRALDGVALDEPEVALWVRQSLEEEIQQLFGGVLQ